MSPETRDLHRPSPGPWRSGPLGAGTQIVSAIGSQVAVVYSPNVNPRAEANVRLIERAMTLYDEFRAIADWPDDMVNLADPTVLQSLRHTARELVQQVEQLEDRPLNGDETAEALRRFVQRRLDAESGRD